MSAGGGGLEVWQQFRNVSVGGGGVTMVHDGEPGSIDMDIRVRQGKEDAGLEFEVAVWNLAQDTWSRVKKGDPCRIMLGWADGQIEPVCFGTIHTANYRRDGNETIYELKGEDETKAQTKAHLSASWRDKDPGDIVNAITYELSLRPGRIERAGGVIEGVYAIKQDEPARYWLDSLVKEAEKITDEAWHWHCGGGRLHFEPKEQQTIQAAILSYDTLLTEIGEASGQSDSEDAQAGELEFEALCEPRIEKNALVVVEHDRFSGVYRVTDYEFKSNTTSGDHIVHGTLTPADARYAWRGFAGRGGLGRFAGSSGGRAI